MILVTITLNGSSHVPLRHIMIAPDDGGHAFAVSPLGGFPEPDAEFIPFDQSEMSGHVSTGDEVEVLKIVERVLGVLP